MRLDDEVDGGRINGYFRVRRRRRQYCCVEGHVHCRRIRMDQTILPESTTGANWVLGGLKWLHVVTYKHAHAPTAPRTGTLALTDAFPPEAYD